MKNRWGKTYLNRLEAPPPDPVARGRALDRSLTTFRQAQRAKSTREAPIRAVVFWRWAAACCVVAVAVAGAILLRSFGSEYSSPLISSRQIEPEFAHGETTSPRSGIEHGHGGRRSAKAAEESSLAAGKQTLQQMEKLFPGQVNAVIERGAAVEIELTPKPQQPSDQRVVVEFSQGSDVLRVLSYSGRQVCVELGGEQICFDALVTAEGGIILMGNDFIWDSHHPMAPSGYRVEARVLNPAS